MPTRSNMALLSREEIYVLRARCGGWSREQAAAFCGVHLDTWNRWESGKTPIPATAARLLRILAGGDLGAIHPDWSGFHLYPDGLLYPPDYARGYDPQDIIGLHWTRQIADAHKNEKRRERQPPRRVTLTVEIDEHGHAAIIPDRKAG